VDMIQLATSFVFSYIWP